MKPSRCAARHGDARMPVEAARSQRQRVGVCARPEHLAVAPVLVHEQTLDPESHVPMPASAVQYPHSVATPADEQRIAHTSATDGVAATEWSGYGAPASCCQHDLAPVVWLAQHSVPVLGGAVGFAFAGSISTTPSPLVMTFPPCWSTRCRPRRGRGALDSTPPAEQRFRSCSRAGCPAWVQPPPVQRPLLPRKPVAASRTRRQRPTRDRHWRCRRRLAWSRHRRQ